MTFQSRPVITEKHVNVPSDDVLQIEGISVPTTLGDYCLSEFYRGYDRTLWVGRKAGNETKV